MDNNQVAQGMAGTILIRGQLDFIKLQTLKAQIKASADVAYIQGVAWL